MAGKPVIPVEILRQLLRYEPETGKLFWRERPPEMFQPGNRTREARCAAWNDRYAGRPAFDTDKQDGYRMGRIFKRQYPTHRVIWAMHHGEWPEGFIDHINGVRDDNRIDNLRVATHELNTRNASVRRNSKSGFLGVRRYICNRYDGYRASIGVGGKTVDLGLYKTLEEAVAARRMAERKYGYPEGCGRERRDYRRHKRL